MHALFHNPFAGFTARQWCLWGVSLLTVFAANLASGEVEIFTLSGTLIGVTALIFVARGDVWGQILTVLFSILYSITALKYRYYSEIITYLGMSAPIAAASVITRLRHPYAGGCEVEIHTQSRRQTGVMWVLTIFVTSLFYFILRALDTPNLLVSTLSVLTSFLASYLMPLRCCGYALAYAVNDIVLILLWVCAAREDMRVLPMVLCFSAFLINDLYGFISWKKRKKAQSLI